MGNWPPTSPTTSESLRRRSVHRHRSSGAAALSSISCSTRCARAETRLGSAPEGRQTPSPVLVINDAATELHRRLAVAYWDHNLSQSVAWNLPIDETLRRPDAHQHRREMFEAECDRPPRDERELTGFIATQSRDRTTCTAGYDMTFSPVKSFSVLVGRWSRQSARKSLKRFTIGLPPRPSSTSKTACCSPAWVLKEWPNSTPTDSLRRRSRTATAAPEPRSAQPRADQQQGPCARARRHLPLAGHRRPPAVQGHCCGIGVLQLTHRNAHHRARRTADGRPRPRQTRQRVRSATSSVFPRPSHCLVAKNPSPPC